MSEYQMKSIPAQNQKVINNLTQTITRTITAAEEEIAYLKASLEDYKEALVDSVNLHNEQADLLAKYSRTKPAQNSYNLPSVFSSSMAAYDMDALRADNARVQEISETIEEGDRQKDLYYKMIMRNAGDFYRNIKKISKTTLEIEQYLAQQKQYAEGNYK
jgi:hypothetical protein